jgi:WD40 repeat protein
LIEKIVLSEDENPPCHTFTPDGNLLVGHANCIYCFSYSTETNTFHKVNTNTIPETDCIITNVNHNSVNMFACGTNTGNIYVFNTTSTLIHTLTEFTKEEVNEIHCIDFKNKTLVASSWSQKQICFDLTTNTHHILEKPKFGKYRTPFIVTNLVITPCMTKVIGTYNFHTFVWDLSTGKIDKELKIDRHTFHEFTPCGSKLVISRRDPIFKIIEWDD